VFYAIFLVEMLLKIIGLGCCSYLKETGNILDMCIVFLSTIDLFFFIFSDQSESNGIGVQVARIFRIFRLIRIFKLSNQWSSMR